MNEVVDEYEKLCQQIWILRNNFHRAYNIAPNNVNVGHEEFHTLQTGNQFIVENGMKNDDNFTIFGMKLKRVTEDNCLSVGFVIEE